MLPSLLVRHRVARTFAHMSTTAAACEQWRGAERRPRARSLAVQHEDPNAEGDTTAAAVVDEVCIF